jgi:hypothetical protein
LHFFAPLNESNPSEEINYNYKSMPSDYDLISRGEDKLFIEKQCLRICYYVQKVHGQEILQMKAEFFKDVHKDIWFYYAHNI